MIIYNVHPVTKDPVLVDSNTGRVIRDFPVHVRHLRAAGMCNREPRIWFKRHGLSWSDFATTGIPASQMLATRDSLAAPVVEIAYKEYIFRVLDENVIVRPEDDWIDRGSVNDN